MVFEAFLSTPAMEAVFAPAAVVQAMMDVEASLARAQARAGLIPPAAAQAIASLCRAELYDVPAILAAAPRAGSLAVPLVQRLRDTVALFDPAAAAYVHWGGSSQDLVDTALLLQTRQGLCLIDEDLQALCGQLLDLADRHPATPLLARSQLQPAQVISLRYKAMNWLLPLLRSAEALRRQADAALLLQLGGPCGTLQAQGDAALAVQASVSQDLRLPVADMCWHTQRDRWVRLGAELGVLCGSLGKLAQDWSLHAQAEVGEVGEPPDSLTSAGPVALMQALAATRRAPACVHTLMSSMDPPLEGGLGRWQAELAAWTGLMRCTHAAVHALAQTLAAPVLHPRRMREHVLAHQGRAGPPLAQDMDAAARLADARVQAPLEEAHRRCQALADRPPVIAGVSQRWGVDQPLKPMTGR